MSALRERGIPTRAGSIPFLPPPATMFKAIGFGVELPATLNTDHGSPPRREPLTGRPDQDRMTERRDSVEEPPRHVAGLAVSRLEGLAPFRLGEAGISWAENWGHVPEVLLLT